MSVLPPDPSVPGAHWLRHPTKNDVIWDWKPRRYTRPDAAPGEWRHGSEEGVGK